jgi:hypothetical protein
MCLQSDNVNQRSRVSSRGGPTHSRFQFGILILDVDKILDDVERPGEDKREEKAKPCEVHVALRA